MADATTPQHPANVPPTQSGAPLTPEQQARVGKTNEFLKAISTTPTGSANASQGTTAPSVDSRAVPTPKAAPPAAPTTPVVKPSITAGVVAANAKVSPFVVQLRTRTKSTKDLVSPWFRLLLHGEIDSKKTTTAAHFGSPEQTRIILTRGEDQLAPIRSEGYQYLAVENANEFTEAMKYCGQIWPEWAKHPEPVLIVDDLTRGKDYVLKDSSTYVTGSGEEKEFKDNRKIHVGALQSMDAVFSVVNRKPMHVILIATSKVRENNITQEESIFPDLPPAMSNLIMSDYSFIFFINKKKPTNACLLTSKDFESVTEYDEGQKKNVTHQRFFFARHKLPWELESKGVLRQYENLDLRGIWNRIKTGTPWSAG